MKILVLSDSHGNIARLKHVFGFAQTSSVDAVIHCGDWDTPEAVATAANLDIPVYGVLGNADVDPAIPTSLEKSNVIFNHSFLKLELGGRKIGVCHFSGKAKEMARSGEFDIVFHGHFHRRKEEVVDNITVVNPGALTGPDLSFAVYDTQTNAVQFVDVAL